MRELLKRLWFWFLGRDWDQRWFWTKEWQSGEREADADIAAGRYETFESMDAFVKSLEERHEF